MPSVSSLPGNAKPAQRSTPSGPNPASPHRFGSLPDEWFPFLPYIRLLFLTGNCPQRLAEEGYSIATARSRDEYPLEAESRSMEPYGYRDWSYHRCWSVHSHMKEKFIRLLAILVLFDRHLQKQYAAH